MDVDDGPAKPAANGEAAPSSGARPVDVVSGGGGEEDTLPGVVRGFVDGVWSAPGGDEPLLRRLKAASCEAAPRLRGASRNSARDLLEWTRRGSGLRAILVISVGTITLIALTGLLIFMFFLLVATANAVIVSVLMSLAAAGGFLAIFFACLVAVYVGAVSVAVFAISATVISAIVGVMIATAVLLRVYVRAGPWLPSESTARAEERAPEGGGRLRRERGAGETMGEGSGWVQRGAVGMRHPQDCATGRSACKMQRALQTPLELLQWPLLPHFGDAAPFAHTAGVSLRRYFILDILKGWVGFFWMIWFAARKSMDLTKHSIGATTSAIQSYSASRNANWKPAD